MHTSAVVTCCMLPDNFSVHAGQASLNGDFSSPAWPVAHAHAESSDRIATAGDANGIRTVQID